MVNCDLSLLSRKYGDREYFGGLGLQNQEFAVWPGRSGVNISDLARWVRWVRLM